MFKIIEIKEKVVSNTFVIGYINTILNVYVF